MAEYLVRASALEGYNSLVHRLGGDPAALRGEAGIVVDNAPYDSWITYRAFLELLENSATQLNCPHFGLELSRQQGINILGTVGFVMRQAPDVITALGELRTYFAQHNQGAEVTLRLDKDTAMLGFDSKMPGHVPMYQGIDLVGGVGLNIMRLLCGARWSPKALYVPHQAPADPRPYKSLFGCPIHFDADLSVMVFDAAVLQRPISEADEHLHQILANHLSLLQQSYPDSFPDQVKHLIRQALLTGSCSIERVADYLSVTKRTLQRRLSREGVSYKTLLEQVRLDMATRYLLESRASLTDLADMLGYSELSAFSNAFKQQTGMSPRQWRAQFAR